MHFFANMHCLIFGTADSYATAHKHYRAFGFIQSRNSLLHQFFIRHHSRQLTHLCRAILHHSGLHIMRYIHKHRTGTSAFGNLEGQAHSLRQLLRLIDQKILLSNRHGNTGDIYLLKSIMTNHTAFYLTGNSYYRNRIQKSICQSCYQIGGTGAGCSTANTNLTAGTRKAICRMHSALLMGCQNMLNACSAQSIIERQYSAAGITKNC